MHLTSYIKPTPIHQSYHNPTPASNPSLRCEMHFLRITSWIARKNFLVSRNHGMNQRNNTTTHVNHSLLQHPHTNLPCRIFRKVHKSPGGGENPGEPGNSQLNSHNITKPAVNRHAHESAASLFCQLSTSRLGIV